MLLRTTLATAALLSLPLSAQADHSLCCKLFGHHCQPCCPPPCGTDCQVHVHYCQPPAEQYAPAQAPARDISPQMLYAPILPSAVGYTMPMMPMMQMGMMPSYAMQPQAYAVPQAAAAPQPPAAAPRSCADESSCGSCEPRVARLEDGVKNISARMDRIELILENQTRALEGLLELKKKQAQEPAH